MSNSAVRKASFCNSSSLMSSLDELYKFVAEDLNSVNITIMQKLTSQIPLISNLAGHLIQANGKRLRPMLTLACTRLAGYDGQRHIPLAACVEFIHTATLLHDDVIDESNLRRGKAAANVLWGNKASVLVGDFLFSQAFELMVADGSLEILEILSKAASTIVEGEVLQLTATNDITLTEEDYLKVIQAKTAHLFAASCHIGGVIAECSPERKNALAAFGHHLGVIFQLIDDALDYYGDETQLGKTPGNDFREGKITLPVILAYRHGNPHEQEFWSRTLKNLDQNLEDFNVARDYLKKYDILVKIKKKAEYFSQSAHQALMMFPPSPLRQLLLNVTDFCINRLN